MLVHKLDIEFVAVVSPGAKLEPAGLHIEGEVFRVEGAGRPQDGLRHPQNVTAVVDHSQGVALLVEPVVRAVEEISERKQFRSGLGLALCQHTIL